MGSRGSLSTILAGVLVLMALFMGIAMALEVISTGITLGQLTASHIRTVGEEAAKYSGLIVQGGTVVSTKGPITVIGAVTPSGFQWVNETTYTFTANTTEPELLLTNVGPVMLDPERQFVGNAGLADNGMNIVSNYLNHWVEAVVVTGQETQQVFSGVIVMIGNELYLLHISKDNEQNYIVGPLMGSNTYVIHDYG
ncbi:MAG: hypothetical protein ACP5GY_02720, partial [Vulcanisaeta sp.]